MRRFLSYDMPPRFFKKSNKVMARIAVLSKVWLHFHGRQCKVKWEGSICLIPMVSETSINTSTSLIGEHVNTIRKTSVSNSCTTTNKTDDMFLTTFLFAHCTPYNLSCTMKQMWLSLFYAENTALTPYWFTSCFSAMRLTRMKAFVSWCAFILTSFFQHVNTGKKARVFCLLFFLPMFGHWKNL